MTADPLKQRLHAACNLPRAWRLVWRAAPGWMTVNLALLLVQSLLPLASLVLLKQVIDALGSALAAPQAADFVPVALWIALAGVVALASMLVNTLAGHAAEAQALAVTDHVADVIHQQSIAVDLGYYENPAFHDSLHLAQRDALSRPASIVTGLKQTLQSTLTLCGIVALLFSFHWLVGLALLLAALPAGAVRLFYARQLYAFERDRAELERQAWYYHWLVTSLEFARDIRLLEVGALFAGRFSALRRQLREGRLAISARRTRRDMLTQGLATVALYATLGLMAFAAIQGRMTIGLIVMYFQAYQRALTALQGVLQGLAWLYEDNLFLRHFYDFLDLPSAVETSGSLSRVPEPAALGLVCRDLTFTYPSRREPALAGVDLEIRPGEVVALVGANGAGKTTLAKLLCRLYDPDRGTISWEGVPLASFVPQSWRRQVSVISQDFARFDLTVAENIRLGDVHREEDQAALQQAIRASGLLPVLAKLPDGQDTLLGTQFREGQELSTGEWQRLALARAYYRAAPFLILDEPSSALDPLAEAAMLSSFRTVIGQRSALVISHRLSTMHLVDRVYLMDAGRIVEHGTHTELLERNGAYARLFRTQAEHYRA